MPINFNFNFHLSSEIKEFLMSQFSDLTAELKTAIAGAVSRITEDFDALRAKIDAGTITDAELDDFRAAIASINAIDPDPSNPPAPAPEPNPTPEPNPEPEPTPETPTA